MTGVLTAIRVGRRRVSCGWRPVVLTYACNLLLAMVLGAMLLPAIASSVGSSLAGPRLLAGFDSFWFNSFSAQATGVASTFRPTVVGIGAVLDALDSFLSGFDGSMLSGLASGVLPVAALYLLLWCFFGGGFFAMYASGDIGTARPAEFLRAAARWFPRMFVVTVIGLVFYSVMLLVARPLLDLGIYILTRQSIDERVFFAWTLAGYLLLWTVVWLGNMVLDYAKVAMVLRDDARRIAAPLHAIGTAFRFIVRYPRQSVALYVANGALWVATLLVYWAIVPGSGQSSAALILGVFLLGQLFVFSRIWIRCLFYASETALYQSLGLGGPAAVGRSPRSPSVDAPRVPSSEESA